MNIEESKIAEDSEGRKTLDLGGSYCRNDPGWNYNPGRIEKQLEQVVNKKTAGYAPELAAQVKADTEHYQDKQTAAHIKRKRVFTDDDMPVMGNAYHESVPLSPVEKDTGNHEAPMLRIQTPVYQDRHAYEMPNDKDVEISQAILGSRNGNVGGFTPLQKLVSLDGYESEKKREPVLSMLGPAIVRVKSAVQYKISLLKMLGL